MISIRSTRFKLVQDEIRRALLSAGDDVDVGEWQSIPRAEKDLPQQRTIELENVVFEMGIPTLQLALVREIQPNLPFAEAQFQDRISGQPLNPPPSDKLWPWAAHLDESKPGGKYSHTYPERFWPKYAGDVTGPTYEGPDLHEGIRFAYGDLGDVVAQLKAAPRTRQAYLPVWFPEDTGAVHKQRVPCSLGYHFLCRRGWLDVTYFIRSVDFFRHFPDDVYMAARLCQWVAGQMSGVKPGTLTMHMCSLHVFQAERKRLEEAFE